MRRRASNARLNECATGWQRTALFLALFAGLADGPLVESRAALAALPAQGEVSPEATPTIKSVKPAEGRAGDELALAIEGSNFSKGVYVSFSSPAVHAVSTRRVSASQLEARVEVGKKAPLGPVILYVSNPASAAVQATFSIVAEPAAAPPASPATTGAQTTTAGAPEVTGLDPSRAARGGEATLRITGKNFVRGTKVAFANPDILVSETEAPKPTELTARIRIAADATAGKTSLFVVNPDDQEVEVGFEVTTESVAAGSTGSPAPASSKPASTEAPSAKPAASTGGAAAVRFEVFNLGSAASILQSGGKAKGTLSLAGEMLRYEEGGAEVFSAPASEVKEIGPNVIAGFNTGTFHVILTNGKAYNFAATSFKPADSESIVDSLRRALH